MKVLVVGSGGREHALVWALARSHLRPTLFCAPGNAGTRQQAENLPIAAEDLDALCTWAEQHRPDLTVVGPEAPLCAGLADRLRAMGLAVFGPEAAAARLEGSKAFAKEVMQAAGVPTARAGVFSDVGEALRYIDSLPGPCVVKADGLAAGKGVILCDNRVEAEAAVRNLMEQRVFGAAGGTVLIEEMLVGEEVSVLALVDGERSVLLPSSQDHKRAFDRDQGPNTGGMGAYSPAPLLPDSELPAMQKLVIDPVVHELKVRGIRYCGVLYAGLMMTADGPRVLEYNVRFGDPETQCLLPRLDVDWVDVMTACVQGRLDPTQIRVRPGACACVVMSAGGYPEAYRTGHPILGLEQVDAMEGVAVFHAGTASCGEQVLTAGGRVLGVTGRGDSLEIALQRAYAGVHAIAFQDRHFRTDIGARALHLRPVRG